MEKLPIIVCGEVIECSDTRENIVLEYEDGYKLQIPLLSEADVDKIVSSRLNTGLDKIHIDEITLIFQKFALEWQKKENETRTMAVDICHKVTGYSRYMIERDYLGFTSLFSLRGDLYDQLDADLGNYNVLEEWIINKDCYLHAVPAGLVTNVLVGNIPLATVFGVFRSLVVKNNTVCKIPKRDPAGAICFALELIKNFPDHPLTKSLTVAYWERDSKLGKKILQNSDVLCIWGGADSIGTIRNDARFDANVVTFGPKRSIAIVDLAEKELDDTFEDIAYRLAQDFSLYDQEACFSSQELYIKAKEEEYNIFLKYLIDAMNFNVQKYPKEIISKDNSANVLIKRREALYNQEKVISTTDHKWTIIESDRVIEEHPLSRTVYIHKFSEYDLTKWINRFTQTIVLYPWRNNVKYRDEMSIHGAARIVGIGMSGTGRTGFTHDGYKPFSEMVRWVSVEKDLDYMGKFSNLSKEEYTNVLYKSIWNKWDNK